MLLGYHLFWTTGFHIVGTPEQAERFQELVVRNNYYVSGAVNPRDYDLKITDDGDNIVYNGFKHFNTGGTVSDLVVLEGALEGSGDHIFVVVNAIIAYNTYRFIFTPRPRFSETRTPHNPPPLPPSRPRLPLIPLHPPRRKMRVRRGRSVTERTAGRVARAVEGEADIGDARGVLCVCEDMGCGFGGVGCEGCEVGCSSFFFFDCAELSGLIGLIKFMFIE